MYYIGLALAFLIELIVFVCFASVGFLLPVSALLQLVTSVILFCVLIIFWSLYMSPKANKKLNVVGYYASKIVIYLVAVIIIFMIQNLPLSMMFVIVVLFDELLLFKYNAARLL
jgi:hypothetical protein